MMNSRHFFRVTAVSLAAVILALDLSTDAEVDIPVLYVLIIFLALKSCTRRVVLAVAVGCAVLTVVGWAGSPGSVLGFTAIANHILALLALGLVTLFGLRDAAAQAELRKNQQLLRGIIDFSDDAIITKALDGRVTSWNPGAQRLFGQTAQQAIGHSMYPCVPPERLEEEQTILAKVARDQLVDHFETVRLHADGTRIDISTTVSPIKDGSGSTIGTSTIARNITDRKVHERRMQAQLARLNLLQRVTRAIGERLDVDSIYQVVIRSLEDHLSVDFAAIALYEPAAQEIVIKRIGVKGHEIAKQVTLAEEGRIAIDQNGLGRCVRGELVYEPDISTSAFPFPGALARAGLRALVFAPLSVADKVFGVLVAARRDAASFVSTDCEFLLQLSDHVALAAHHAQIHSALQNAYEDLRHTQQAVVRQERLRMVGQMASGIAHDLINALTPASLYAQMLLEGNPELSEDARHSLSVIQQAIEDAGRTLRRLQTFYRPRQSEIESDWIDLNSVLRQVADITRARWKNMPQERGVVIQLQMDLAPELPRMMAAINEIRDALTNLVLNAVDAMPDGGTLTLRSHLHTARNGELVRVAAEVIDTGVGMSETVRNRCIEPFFTTKGERGTGLGLAMVYGTAQRHGADFDIESEVGRGTTVRLSFPVMSAAETSDTAVPGDVVSMPLRVLLVDDDPLILESLGKALRSDGHSVVAADGGQSGIDEFLRARERGEAFDIVISDLGMPNVDGRTVAAAIRSAEPRTPIVLITGWGQRLQGEDELPRYVDHVLTKPPRIPELRNVVRKLVRVRRQN
jgi:PAS domain S-box-containing protein